MIEITMSPASPFVRKARIAAMMKGLAGPGSKNAVAFIDPEGATAEQSASLRAANPLAKIPIARLDDGSVIFDSHVICEYLDHLAPSPRLFPAPGPERWRALTLAALGDGIADAAILIVYETRYRPKEKHVQAWLDHQQAKIDGAIAEMERHTPDWTGHPDYGHVTLACALGYVDLRLGGHWRDKHPKLAAWLERFAAAVPAYAATAMPKA